MYSEKEVIILSAPDHSWAKVPIGDVIESGVSADISSFSYALSIWAYLETDSDYPKYYKAMLAKGVKLVPKTEYIPSFDRLDKWSFADDPVQRYIAVQLERE